MIPIMTVSFLSFLLAGISLLSITAGVVYYVKSTETCAHNSSCRSNETCQTIDHYASNSSRYFSPGPYQCHTLLHMSMESTAALKKLLTVHDLQTFTMIGLAGRQLVSLTRLSLERESGNCGQSSVTAASICAAHY